MRFWLIHFGGLIVAWRYTDLDSESLLQSNILPLIIVGLLISVALRLAVNTHNNNSGGHGDGGGFFGGPDGGDGGCGGDGGGC